MTERVLELMRALGARIVSSWIWRLGFACRFLWLMLLESAPSFRRFHLTIREIYSRACSRSSSFSSRDCSSDGAGAAGLRYAGAIRLVRRARRARQPVAGARAGPVVAGLLFASRAGSAITAEIGLMKATEQLSAMEMMAVDRLPASSRRVSGPG